MQRWIPSFVAIGVVILSTSTLLAQKPAVPSRCDSIIKADVVALDQASMVTRLGAIHTDGEIYALRQDVLSSDPSTKELRPGKVMLRADKRPRPIVLRVNAGSCLEIAFQNLLDPKQKDPIQPVTRVA